MDLDETVALLSQIAEALNDGGWRTFIVTTTAGEGQLILDCANDQTLTLNIKMTLD